jgi:hypothetical protein
LLTRFESDHGYRDFDDTLRCRKPDLKTSAGVTS